LREINSPVPRPLQVAADVAISHQASRIARAMARGEADTATARSELLSAAETAQRLGARLDPSAVYPYFEEALNARMARLSRGEADAFAEAAGLLELAARLSLQLDLWSAQNEIWSLAASGAFRDRSEELPRLARQFWFDEATLLARAARPAGEATTPSAAPAAGPAAARSGGPNAAAAAPAL
jgi:hypothetical protein